MRQRKGRFTLSITPPLKMTDPVIHATPWDTKVFNHSCFEITEINEETLRHAATTPGHYTVKVDPLASKALLHKYGFYYTDTLIQPYCKATGFVSLSHKKVSIGRNPDIDMLLPMCDGAFLHGRFHRDFNLKKIDADRRYKQWLIQLHEQNGVLALLVERETAGFIAHDQGNLLLHTVDKRFRGQGLAKYLWSAACEQLFGNGIQEISSSISAANLAVLNLYASLGFRFKDATDIYHRLTPEPENIHVE